MPRSARSCPGGYTYHVLNRGNARAAVFHGSDDDHAFIEVMAEASIRAPMRVLTYWLMPNHFRPAVWPREDGDLSRWMHWLMTTPCGATWCVIAPAVTSGKAGSRHLPRRKMRIWISEQGQGSR